MKRYYYDCAISAQYMNKYHGIKFYIPETEDVQEEILYSESDIQCAHEMWGETEFTVYPESHALLQPQEGDVVQRMSIDGFWRVREIPEFIIFSGYGHGDYHFSKKEGIVNDFLTDIKIIQRNGLSFIMPKKEV